jgi:hypothetical protein
MVADLGVSQRLSRPMSRNVNKRLTKTNHRTRCNSTLSRPTIRAGERFVYRVSSNQFLPGVERGIIFKYRVYFDGGWLMVA